MDPLGPNPSCEPGFGRRFGTQTSSAISSPSRESKNAVAINAQPRFVSLPLKLPGNATFVENAFSCKQKMDRLHS
jgi:hypothetical protein